MTARSSIFSRPSPALVAGMLVIASLSPSVLADEKPSALQALAELFGEKKAESDERREDPQLRELFETVKPVAARAAKATVWITLDEQRLAMGTVIDPEKGLLVTKASEIGSRPVNCRLADGRVLPTSREATWAPFDLALLRIDPAEAGSLEPAPWSEVPDPGSLVAAPLPGGFVVGVGVVSVPPRDLSESGKGYLGVSISKRPRGLTITEVNEPSAAAKAGLQEGDIILQLNGDEATHVPNLIERIAKTAPGDAIELRIRRDEAEETVQVRLGDRDEASELFNPLNPMDQMGGKTSKQRTGYPSAWQHDIGLPPDLMGGPLVDLNGQIIGVNIARAGRVKTYAIPSQVILVWVQDRRGDEVVSAESSAGELPSDPDLDALVKRLSEAEAALRDAREALEHYRKQAPRSR